MDIYLRCILIISSILFFVFIYRMVVRNKFELKYALTWMLMSIFFILLAFAPGIITVVANLLFIRENVNALFLIVIFFLILIIFTLSIAVSKNSSRVKSLSQEIGILKLSIEIMKKDIRGDEN